MSPTSASWLRLALFTDTFAPQMNGVARTLGRLADAVCARGGEVLVVTPSDPRTTARRDAHADAYAVERCASVSFWKYDELRLAAPASSRGRRAVEAFAPTLVHAATPFGVGIAGRTAARALGVPLVTSYHTSFSAYTAHYGLGALARPAWAYLRWFHNGGRRTFCPTDAVRRELETHGFEGVSVWGRGIDPGRFTPTRRDDALRARLGAGPDDLVVAYVGRLAAEKGLDRAMAAVRSARRILGGRPSSPRLLLALAGDGPYAARCRQLAPPDTTFVGRLEGPALASFYASADLFLFPSVTDTFGNVLLEAMASRLAVVAADVPPTRELLGLDDDGPPRGVAAAPDAESLGRALAALARDPARRAALAADFLPPASETAKPVTPPRPDDRLCGLRRVVPAALRPRPEPGLVATLFRLAGLHVEHASVKPAGWAPWPLGALAKGAWWGSPMEDLRASCREASGRILPAQAGALVVGTVTVPQSVVAFRPETDRPTAGETGLASGRGGR